MRRSTDQTMKPATVHDLVNTTGGRWRWNGHGSDLTGMPLGPIQTDSRALEPGAVFWALPGPRYDGADFVREAVARGASGVVTSRPAAPQGDCWVLCVDNSQAALWRWAAWHRRRFSGTLIAVTGSVGKTTTRQMIHTVLGSRLRGTCSPRNYNNHVGVPLSMLALRPEHDYAVLELGASGPGEIAALAALTAPRVGVITQVGDAHLGGFGSRRGIAEGKAELLAALPPHGLAVMGSDPWLQRMASRSRAAVVWVGCGDDCGVKATELRSEEGQLRFRVGSCPFAVPIWGRHHLTAALAAVAVARSLGFDLEEIAAALARFEPLPLRCEVIQVRGATIINDTYNSSPTAVRAALELVRDMEASGRRIVVCGDMAELGDEAASLHRQIGAEVVRTARAHLLIACGRFARRMVEGAREAGLPASHSIPCPAPDDALPFLGQAVQPGDIVLVKGARVLAMERIVEALQHFPQRKSA